MIHPYHLEAELGLFHMGPKIGSNRQKYDIKSSRMLKISCFNHSFIGHPIVSSNVCSVITPEMFPGIFLITALVLEARCNKISIYKLFCLFDLMLYVYSKQLRSCQDGQ